MCPLKNTRWNGRKTGSNAVNSNKLFPASEANMILIFYNSLIYSLVFCLTS